MSTPILNVSLKDLADEIREIKRNKKALILAHYYQLPEIQDVADMVGDSLQMADYAACAKDAEILVIAGVCFMAETAKILNPSRKVLLPDLMAGCSLADSCQVDELKAIINQHPGCILVAYINCSAEIKAMSDIVCTSSNAVKIVQSLPQNKPIIFVPDANLGQYVMQKTGRELILWNGSCLVHENFSMDKILNLHQLYPDAQFIAHPEAQQHILRVASYVGSTKGIIDYIKKSNNSTFIVGTEVGILHQLYREVPNKTIIPAPVYEDNTCACSECPYMKMNTLSKLYNCLVDESPAIAVSESTRVLAEKALKRMLMFS